MNDTIVVKTELGREFSFLFSKESRELCELYEHDGYPEWKCQLYRSIFSSFDRTLDLTPDFGFFSINLSLDSHQPKTIGLREDRTENAQLLKDNLINNNIQNTFCLSYDITPQEINNNCQNINLTIVRSTSAVELIRFFRAINTNVALPALLMENLNSHNDYHTLTQQLINMGYKDYTYCPLIKKLIPSEFHASTSQEAEVIFYFASSHIDMLSSLNKISNSETNDTSNEISPHSWETLLRQKPYSSAYMKEWTQKNDSDTTYIQLLNLAINSLCSDNAEDKLNLMLSSYSLLKTLSIEDFTFPQLLTATRIVQELGKKLQCKIYLSKLIETFQSSDSIDFSEPFLPTLEKYEQYNIEEDKVNWCLSSILEIYEKNRTDSSFGMSNNDFELIELYLTLPYANHKLLKRYEIYKAIHDVKKVSENIYD